MTVTVYVPEESLPAVRLATRPDGGRHWVGWTRSTPTPGTTVLSEGRGVKWHRYVAVSLTPEEFRLLVDRAADPDTYPPGTEVTCRGVPYRLASGGPDGRGLYELRHPGSDAPFHARRSEFELKL